MHWQQIQQQWQQQVAPEPAETSRVSAESVHADSRRLRRRVWWRDGIESTLAVLMIPVFAWSAIHAWGQGNGWAVLFSALLVAWLLFLPWWLWRARRQLPVPQPQQSLLAFLAEERNAMLAQARLLETVWRWCLGPVALGVIGFHFAVAGATRGSFIYAGVVLIVYAGIDWLNRVTARRRFHSRVAEIDSLLSELAKETNP